MAGANLTDQQILQYWKNPLYSFAFRGARNFSLLLKTDLGIDVPASRINRILQREPIFLIHQRRHKKILRRHFYLTTIGQTVQADIAYMFSENSYRYFLLVIDCYSKKVFTQKLKTKNGPEVAKALRSAFDELGVQIHVFETDRGSEFKSSQAKRLYQEKKIVYKFKYGLNKG